MNFAVIGAAGFVTPRHLQAIKDTGNQVVAAVDPNDSVGILDRYSPDIEFFTDFYRFSRHIEKRPVDWVSVCSPNHLHDVHAKAALRAGANVICEKPLTTSPWNLDALEKVETETGKRVFTVLQLRLHDKVIALKDSLANHYHSVALDYVTPRGKWYARSWKADVEKSGGLTTNIGIHLFDLLIHLFGSVEKIGTTSITDKNAGGTLFLKRAEVTWRLSIDPSAGGPTRKIAINGKDALELSDGFSDLHTKLYERTLAGEGFGIADARPAVELTYDLRRLAGL